MADMEGMRDKEQRLVEDFWEESKTRFQQTSDLLDLLEKRKDKYRRSIQNVTDVRKQLESLVQSVKRSIINVYEEGMKVVEETESILQPGS